MPTIQELRQGHVRPAKGIVNSLPMTCRRRFEAPTCRRRNGLDQRDHHDPVRAWQAKKHISRAGYPLAAG